MSDARLHAQTYFHLRTSLRKVEGNHQH